MSAQIDFEQILKEVVNETEECLNVEFVAPSSSGETERDGQQALKLIYNPINKTLRAIEV